MPDGPANPFGVGFCATETVLNTEQQAQRNGNPAKSRIWKVKNPNSLNRMNGAQLCAAVVRRACMAGRHRYRVSLSLAVPEFRSEGSYSSLCPDRAASGLEAGAGADAAPVCQPQQLAPPPRQIRHQGGNDPAVIMALASAAACSLGTCDVLRSGACCLITWP